MPGTEEVLSNYLLNEKWKEKLSRPLAWTDPHPQEAPNQGEEEEEEEAEGLPVCPRGPASAPLREVEGPRC